MFEKVVLDGVEYDTGQLSSEGKALLAAYSFADRQLQEALSMRAVLTRARNSYIAELKSEMVKGKTGLELSDLFGDD